jgi:hypothetical protein
MPRLIPTSGVLTLVGQAVPPALRPSDFFFGASGRACPAPTPDPCRGEACLALALDARRRPRGNHAAGAIAHIAMEAL